MECRRELFHTIFLEEERKRKKKNKKMDIWGRRFPLDPKVFTSS
jgi:hypothetical protein